MTNLHFFNKNFPYANNNNTRRPFTNLTNFQNATNNNVNRNYPIINSNQIVNHAPFFPSNMNTTKVNNQPKQNNIQNISNKAINNNKFINKKPNKNKKTNSESNILKHLDSNSFKERIEKNKNDNLKKLIDLYNSSKELSTVYSYVDNNVASNTPLLSISIRTSNSIKEISILRSDYPDNILAKISSSIEEGMTDELFSAILFNVKSAIENLDNVFNSKVNTEEVDILKEKIENALEIEESTMNLSCITVFDLDYNIEYNDDDLNITM